MSDPAKTPEEIEDVLASIRRLVSDHTPGPDGSMRPAEPSDKSAPRDRLVLTQSHRVQEPDDPWSPVAGSDAEPDTSDAEGDTETQDSPASEPDLTDSLVLDVLAQEEAAETDEAVMGDDNEWQPDDRMAEYDTVGTDEADDLISIAEDEEAEPEPDAEPAEDVTSDTALGEADSSLDSDFESETGDDNWPGEGAEAALLTLVARRDPAGVGERSHGPDRAADEAEPDELTGDAEAKADASENEAAPGAEALADDIEMAHADETPDTVSEADAITDEPPVTPIFSRPMRKARDAGEAEATDAYEAEDLGEEPSPFSFPDAEDGVLDEETLREIIVDVVREELQGVLGQRITRNVRKMVRREIRLALAAEDLD